MKKISCICTILILAAVVVTNSFVFPASAQTMEKPFDEPWRFPQQTEVFSADAAENAESDVTVEIYNIQGRLVRVFDLGMQPAGSYVTKDRAVYWNGKNEAGERVASGVYFYRLKAEHPEAGAFSAIRRLVVVK